MAKKKTRVVFRPCPKQAEEIRQLKEDLEAARRAAHRVPDGSAEIARLKVLIADLRARLEPLETAPPIESGAVK